MTGEALHQVELEWSVVRRYRATVNLGADGLTLEDFRVPGLGLSDRAHAVLCDLESDALFEVDEVEIHRIVEGAS